MWQISTKVAEKSVASNDLKSYCYAISVETQDSPESLAPEYQSTRHYILYDCNLESSYFYIHLSIV
jgi:hypothetical protein